MTELSINAASAGRFTFPDTEISVNRMGYGAMQLAGPHVFGEPKNPEEARAVLREALVLGVDHIDTSDFYGPYVTNRLIHETLWPYPKNLTIVSKIGARRDDKGAWILDLDADFLRRSIHDNLEHLELDRIDIVNLRIGTPEDGVVAPMQAMQKMREEGLIGHIGISTVTEKQLHVARDIAPIVCVQNHYNLVHREDDQMIDMLADAGIAYVPYFPLGGFSPIQSEELNNVARKLGHSAQQIALAWLLQRNSNILLIPGTSTRRHLHENVAAASLKLAPDVLKRLDRLSSHVWGPQGRSDNMSSRK